MEIQELLVNGEIEEALDRMDSAPAWVKRVPEFILMQAAALMEYGDIDEGGRILRELERKQPRFTPLYLPLATWYMMQEWPAHALRAIRKTTNYPGFDAEAKEMTQSLFDGAKEMIGSLASHLNLPFDKAEQATWYNEQSQLATLDSNLIEVERHTKEALKIAPHWCAPRNNYSHALYLLGKCSDAIAEAETVLTDDPSNFHGLKNLTTFHVGLGNVEKAKEYAKRLLALSENLDDESFEIDIVISALALTEDTDHLWELAQRYLRRPKDQLISYSWQCLGVAAAHAGHFKEAKKLLERGADDDLDYLEKGESALEKVTKALKSGTKKLIWPPMYPGLEVFISERFLNDWAEIAEKVRDEKPTPGQQRKIDAILARYPFALYIFKRMLWSEEASALGASALAMLNKPEADAEILHFAFSDWGDNDSRMEAVMMLTNTGRYSPEEAVKFWDSEKEEWHDVQMFSQQIGDVEYDIKPQTADLITKARETKDPQESISLLRRAVESDPTCAMALNNLGVFLSQQGQNDEGEEFIRRAVEVNPNYTFGHANLGFLEAQRGNKEAALDHLMYVNKAKVITPETAVIASLAHMLIALDDHDIERAREIFETAKEIYPDHPMLDQFEERLDLVEKFSDIGGFLRDFQKQSANRFHRKMLNTLLTAEMTLEACLSKMTNDTLVGTCRLWKTVTYGKKQEMVSRLVERILDQEIMRQIIKDEVQDQERDALQWILDGGGWRSWKEFTQKFGDDMDESAYWRVNEPESIPGRLKMAGFLFVGKLDGQEVAFIPADLRPRLAQSLATR
jgi:tetratricopeptide (TPR) repeat protein